MDKAVRERANQYGIGTLFDIEAFSLLSGIRVGALNEFKSIKELQANYKMLEVTKLQSQKLEAFFELCQRVGRQNVGEVSKITSSKDVYNLVRWDMENLKKEQFKVVLLDTKNKVIAVKKVSEGSLSACIVHPREVFKEAIRHSANSFIAVHNHPSGDPTPSQEDIAITRRLRKVGETVGIQLLDHIIVGKGEYRSLKEERQL